MPLQDELKKQAIPKFKNHYVRYFDLEQISRESVDETRGLGEGTTLRYLRASHALRVRSASRTGTSASSAAHPSDASLPSASYFAKALEQELRRVRRYVEIFSEEVWVQLGAIVDSLAKVATPRAVGETLSTENLEALTEQCNEIGADIVLLDEFLRQNVVACAHLTQKHETMAFAARDAEIPQDPQDLNLLYIQAMEQSLMGAVENGTILVNLSDIYSQIRQLHSSGSGGGWFTPKSEDPQPHSMKFWVHPGDVLKLKCELIKHLPISTSDREMYSSGVRGKKLSFLKDESLQEWHQVKSIYFDTSNMGTYREWTESDEDSSVIRASWHGGQGLHGDQTVYLTKRFKDNHMNHQGSRDLAGVDMVDFGKFLAGSPVAAVQSDSRQPEWLENIQRRLATKQEFPRLRVENRRTVFDENYSSEVMMSLDTHVRFMRELGSNERVGNPFTDSRVKSSPGAVHHFPYAILEVEQTCEITPSWIQELMHSGVLKVVPNFSKFLHGAAVLFPDEIVQAPHWFVQSSTGQMVPATLEQVAEMFEQEDIECSEISLRPVNTPNPGVNVTALVQDGHTDVLSHVLMMQGAKQSDLCEPVSRKSLKLNPRLRDNDSAKESSQSGEGSDRKEGKSLTLASWKATRKKTKHEDDPPPGDSQGKVLPKAPALVRTRIEPKTFFANERTFLSWLSIAVLVMFMGLSLLGGNKLGGGGGTVSGEPDNSAKSKSIGAAHISGALISPVAVLLLVYALFVYRKRSRQILHRETVRYDDQKGPIVITLVLIIVLVMAYGFSIQAAFGQDDSKGSPVAFQP